LDPASDILWTPVRSSVTHLQGMC